MEISKEIYGYISLVLTFVSSLPYILSVWKGDTKPHFFSWVMWTIPSAIVFAGQSVSNAGAGSWAVGFTVICNLIIVFYAAKYKDQITRSDWYFLFGGFAAIILWVITDNPLYAVILSTVIDVIGYGPTVRKSWAKPYEENVLTNFLCVPKHICSILAMQDTSFVNVVFPYTMVVANCALGIFLLVRRWQQKR
ncbi:MAG: hypothetical protein EB059_03305 [Alphaproteobacteria bacterium]|nr:hypothetical protein [Alphaproteobacteria bacterium]